MTLTLTITANSTTIFKNGFKASASATISGSTNQPTMSDKQMEEMKCALLKILSDATPTSKGPIGASSRELSPTSYVAYCTFLSDFS